MAPLAEMKPQNGLTRENVGDGAVRQYNNAMRQNMRLDRRLLSRISAQHAKPSKGNQTAT